VAKFLSRHEYKALKAGQKAAKEAAIDASDRAATERLAALNRGPVEHARFTVACPDGKCAVCHGTQFQPASRGPDPSAAAVFGIKAAALTAIDTMFNGELAKCVTCGAIYEVG
jgi:hypothetical protein